MTPRKWIESTNAIGIVSKAGRNGGTYAHKDIAIEFASWISPVFKLYLIKEYQRLVELERGKLAQSWNVRRLLSKANYHIHTDAIKNVIIPKLNISQIKQALDPVSHSQRTTVRPDSQELRTEFRKTGIREYESHRW